MCCMVARRAQNSLWSRNSSEPWSWKDQGCHRAACPQSGRLRTRAVAPERTLARVCREAGATVRHNVKLRDMNVAVRGDDERGIEVLATGLPLFQGAQLAVDITLRSALTSNGDPRPGAAREDGIACGARVDKERKYGELTEGNRVVGGRWSVEAFSSWSLSPTLVHGTDHQRWPGPRFWHGGGGGHAWCLCRRAFATSLLAGPRDLHAVVGVDGGAPDLADLFNEA